MHFKSEWLCGIVGQKITTSMKQIDGVSFQGEQYIEMYSRLRSTKETKNSQMYKIVPK